MNNKIFKVLSLWLCLVFTNLAMADNRLIHLLNLHNLERESLGLPILEWSDELAQQADVRIQGLLFEEFGARNVASAGENVWFGNAESATLEEVYDSWEAGKEYFDAEKPVPENCGNNWAACGSYSQIVWAQTTHIGCAAAGTLDKDAIACVYSPSGNVEDQKAY